jgi:MarR family transcriptional regulator, organic hydroperoxide resistance regulator
VVAIDTNVMAKTEPAPSDEIAREVWSLMQSAVFSQRPRYMAVMREFDMVPPHFIVLQALDEPKPMGEVAKLLACDSSNVTWITDRLEERGLVERTPADHDRRIKLLVLTDEGRRVREQIEARLSEPPPAIAALSHEDQRTLRDLLSRAVESLEADR